MIDTNDIIIIKEVDIPSAIISIRNDGIMHIHVKVEMELTIEHSRAITKARNELAEGKAYPMMYTMTKYVIPSNDVSEFLTTQERNELVNADAFVINSLPQRIIGNFYIKFKRPPKPTRLFTDEQKALKWLSNFVTH